MIKTIQICCNNNSKLNYINYDSIKGKIKDKPYKIVKYNKYYDNGKIFIIDENNNEKYMKYLETISTEYIKFDKNYNIKISDKKYDVLDVNDFEIKYNYDKVINIESIQYKYNNFILEFNKCKNNGKIYHKIKIISDIFDKNRLKEIKNII